MKTARHIYLAGKFLFSQYRSCDNTLENCSFQISSYTRTYVRIIYEKAKAKSHWDLYWENKTYKLKRSIGHCHVQAIGV